jgi:hypothetical protein
MQQKIHHRKGKESTAFLEPQMMMRTQLLPDRESVVKYIVQAMCHYNEKEMLGILFNTGNHWLFLNISATYNQVWHCDSVRPTDPHTGEGVTRDYTDVMPILDE